MCLVSPPHLVYCFIDTRARNCCLTSTYNYCCHSFVHDAKHCTNRQYINVQHTIYCRRSGEGFLTWETKGVYQWLQCGIHVLFSVLESCRIIFSLHVELWMMVSGWPKKGWDENSTRFEVLHFKGKCIYSQNLDQIDWIYHTWVT